LLTKTQPHETIGESAYRRIRSDIIFGVLAPGQKLRLEKISESCGTSISTMREPLNRMCAEGLIVAEGQRVATKPQHGKLTPSRVSAVARQNRFSSYSTACLGKTMPGFRVTYISTPGYRGPDSFAIEVIYGNRQPILDTYTVTVE
jgi:predicted transcriptional regulator